MPTHAQAALVLAIATVLDWLLGDPWGWPHPVQFIGAYISRYTGWALSRFTTPRSRRLAGIVLTVSTILGSSLAGGWLVWLSGQVHPWLGQACAAILLASCLAGRSLRRAAWEVWQPLQAGNLQRARARLSRYVGRDTAQLSEAEILRAVLETVAENATDGATAPLFYASLGAFLPIGSVPLALGYKAASTLDSMVGYRRSPYTELGWCSARLEDILTWLPCRLTVASIALLSGRPGRVWQWCWRDARRDPSPNSGWSECAYAAALGVQLGGENLYQGVVKIKPLLGEPLQPLSGAIIQRALVLLRVNLLLWLAIALTLLCVAGF
ncbi:MAG: cobalamin biosynthesis protein [Spirulinaceae cyanobacterium RM2_2_10]|nr:cobalamin biosynthesis protein [Spirulinaceae cyanobacterium SM2_1_0]NJO21460.1 cobalamin biosynthesis protein [Spirulinaceae cyanobacterium RM2_2_10]